MSDMESLARTTLASINPNLSVVKFQTFDAQIADQFTDDRMIARLTMLFGALALMLAAIGSVWRDGVYRGAAHLGDRHPHGAGRGARQRGGDGDARSADADAAGVSRSGFRWRWCACVL